jgi:hypothetical protein
MFFLFSCCSGDQFHLLCDDSNSDGCQRCRPKPTRLCCDLCSPHAFDNLTSTAVPKPAKVPAKSHIKPYMMTTSDLELKRAILEWRQQQMVAKFGALLARKYGAKYLLSEDLVQRIVDCAHASKITSVESIEKETHWNGAKEHGILLLAVIKAHVPACPQPPAGNSLASGVASTNRAPKKHRCGRCNGEGHISASYIFCLYCP